MVFHDNMWVVYVQFFPEEVHCVCVFWGGSGFYKFLRIYLINGKFLRTNTVFDRTFLGMWFNKEKMTNETQMQRDQVSCVVCV